MVSTGIDAFNYIVISSIFCNGFFLNGGSSLWKMKSNIIVCLFPQLCNSSGSNPLEGGQVYIRQEVNTED